jgi:chromate transporter
LTPEWPKIALLLITVAVLLRFKKLPEPIVVLAAAIIGLAIYPLLH